MGNEDVVYEIARYSADGDRLIERFELLSYGTSVCRRSDDGSMTQPQRCTVAAAIARDPKLKTIWGNQLTRITTTALIDDLPAILILEPTFPEDIEEADKARYDEFDGFDEIYRDREVEVNGQKWFIFDGYSEGNLLPTEDLSSALAETWAYLDFDTGNRGDWGAIGLLNPSVVVLIRPNWPGDGHIVSVNDRGNEAGDILDWLIGFGPEDWGGGSYIDTQRILAQTFLETADECYKVDGDYLEEGIAEDILSFGVNVRWDLTLNILPDVTEKVIDLLAKDEEFEELADLVTARRDPQSPTARARHTSLEK